MRWFSGLLIVLAALGVLQWWQTGGLAWLLAAVTVTVIAAVILLRLRRG